VSPSTGRGRIAAFALRQRRAVLLAVIGVCAAGIAAASSMPSGIYPDLRFPRIVVIAERGQDSVENVLVGVTRPLEEAVGAVPGISRVRSKTIRGACEMSIDLAPGSPASETLAQTRAAVASLLPSLPSGVKTTVELQTPAIFPVLSFDVGLDPSAMAGSLRDTADLRAWAETEVKPRLGRLDDVFRVTVQGSEERALVIEMDPDRLASAHLSLPDAVAATRAAQVVEAVGILERDHRRLQLLASNEPRTPADLADLPVAVRGEATVRLGDVATVRRGTLDPTMIVTGDGRKAVVVSVFMRVEGDVVALSDHVRTTLTEVAKEAPAGVRITPVYDQADLVRDSLASIREAIGIGMVLAVVILWAFLASWRLSLLSGLAIPISVLATFAGLRLLGQSLNLMSAGGIAVAIGLMIDDAIVVAENLARRLRSGVDRRACAREATAEVTGAVVGSSLTTVVVFLPLVLLEGVAGQFFTAMAVALSIGIFASLGVSLLLLPGLCSGPLGPKPGLRLTRGWVEAIATGHARVLGAALRHPRWTALALAAILAAGVVPSIVQKTGFLPAMDEGAFVLDYTMPVGTSLAETDSACRRIERVLGSVEGIRAFSRRTGAELGFFATEPNTGDFLVGLKPRDRRQRTSDAIVDEVRRRLEDEVPQAEVSFVRVLEDTINDLAGNPAPIEVKIFGPEYSAIRAAARGIADRLEKVPGVVDVVRDASDGTPEIEIRIDAHAAGRLGLSSTDVAEQLRMGIDGEEVGRVRTGERLIPVIARYANAVRKDPSRLAQTPVYTAVGTPIPASSVAAFLERSAPAELARENGQPLVSVEASLSGRDLGSVSRDVRALLASEPRTRGVRFELAGQAESQQRTFRNLLTVLSLAVGLVLLLLVVQFRSLRLPFVVLLAVPFALVGGLLSLRLLDLPLDVSGLMGLVMLIGLVVKNGIILLEYVAQLRAEGMPTLREALVAGSRTRLRPILMTSLTAIVALVPLALGIGAGSEIQRPLAVTIIGGLTVSTIFTLLVVPVAHLLVGEPGRDAHGAAS